MTAVIGETGAGKSTLIRLILALLEPDKGSIRFYNATREAGASPLTRCNLSFVPQGNTLMSGTIRDNLRMGNPQATEEQMETALHTAAADFVLSLPDGLSTRCGEQGAGLSEGQAQRIAIARGLLRPGGILLLDEPTSALDGPTEQTLLQRLALRLHGKTLVLVTHRDTVARFCSSVIRIKNRTVIDALFRAATSRQNDGRHPIRNEKGESKSILLFRLLPPCCRRNASPDLAARDNLLLV